MLQAFRYFLSKITTTEAPVFFWPEEKDGVLKSVFDALLQANIIFPGVQRENIPCKGDDCCQRAIRTYPDGTKGYRCDCDGIPRIVVSDDELRQWQFDLTEFLGWICVQLGIDEDIRQLNDREYRLGTVQLNGTQHTVYYPLNPDQGYLKSLDQTQSGKEAKRVVWVNPSTREDLLWPQGLAAYDLLKLLHIEKGVLRLENPFDESRDERPELDENTIALDSTILVKKYETVPTKKKAELVFFPRTRREQVEGIEPLHFDVIQYLFTVRDIKGKESKSVEELVGALPRTGSVRSVRKTIREINALCDSVKAAPILEAVTTVPGKKWAINRHLECMQEVHRNPHRKDGAW
jgi:hypothetical protein